MAASPKDKFEAAVKVVRGLPKNGSFQPSHDLMLKFYSYFKQATEGPCTSPKPAFWDVINKRKWEAWSNLGDMRREEAMLSYVDELKKVSMHVRETYYTKQIVETMPQTDAVTEFLQKLDNFYEMVEDSENHNTLKMVDKPKMNGSVGSSLNSENGDEEELSTAYRVTQLLKHDVQYWKDNSGILSGSSIAAATNGSHNLHSSQNGSSYDHIDPDDNEESEYDEQDKELAEEHLNPADSSEVWEAIDESRLSASHSENSSDSESESEEFCDTSDDPVELAIPISPHTIVSILPPLPEKSSTSTPANGGKSVRFSPGTSCEELEASNTLVVDSPARGDDLADLPGCTRQQETLLLDAAPGPSHVVENLDIVTCRGGDEQGRDRRAPDGGHRARGGASSGSSSAQRSGGATGGGNSGGDGQRDFFTGPGGGGGRRGSGAGGNVGAMDLNEQIVVTLLRLQHDMSGVLNRLNSLEALVKEGRKEKDKTSKKTQSWWLFSDLSVRSALLIFVWPLLLHCVITYINHRRSFEFILLKELFAAFIEASTTEHQAEEQEEDQEKEEFPT